MEALAPQADFEEIAVIKKVSVSIQGRGKHRMGANEGAIRRLKDTLSGYLTKSVYMFPMD